MDTTFIKICLTINSILSQSWPDHFISKIWLIPDHISVSWKNLCPQAPPPPPACLPPTSLVPLDWLLWLGLLTFEVRSPKGSLKIALGSRLAYGLTEALKRVKFEQIHVGIKFIYRPFSFVIACAKRCLPFIMQSLIQLQRTCFFFSTLTLRICNETFNRRVLFLLETGEKNVRFIYKRNKSDV